MSALRTFMFGSTANARTTDLGLLILRVFTGLALAIAHGAGKFPPTERFIDGVAKMGFPQPAIFAWAAAGAELIGGVLLAIGLLTRPSALFIAITVGTAAFVRHAADPFSGKEKALLFLAVAVLYLLAGAGRYSIDAMMMRGGGKRR
jgi:putative oxidoreductase